MVRRGIDRLDPLEEPLALPGMAYNRANGHFGLWQMAVARHGVADALAEYRADLHTARDLYAAVGADEDVSTELLDDIGQLERVGHVSRLPATVAGQSRRELADKPNNLDP